jgi:anti-sigma B factor antagonist/stage II sporulation protein AA (anti-sigma F factor antagonist)
MSSKEELVRIKSEVKGEILVLQLTGRLDAVSSPQAEREVFDFINEGHYKLLVDFSTVEYLSSAGMRMLLSITKKLRTLSGKLVICSVNRNVMDVLKMSGFDHVLELFESEDDALRQF